MRCPRCAFDGDLVGGGCARCGYGRSRNSSVSLSRTEYSTGLAVASQLAVEAVLARGSVLRQGRYRLLEQLTLPENQHDQGTAWLASDAQTPQRRVVIREMLPPQGSSSDKEQLLRSAALQMTELGQHQGFPRVIDVFNEQGAYYIVLEQREGESLANLLKRQGGALPEHTIAEYARQVCEMLSLLSQQRPPLVHGSINPDTIIVSPDRKWVSLIHMPLFPPSSSPGKDKLQSSYLAPEQLRNMAGPSSDLYSLAATLHHAVTGYDPSERMAFFHPPARRLNPAVTPSMEAILAQELRLSPSQRYTRPADMQKDLSILIASYPPVIEVSAKPLPPPLLLDSTQMRRRSRNRDLFSIGVIGFVSILLLVGFVLVLAHPFLGPASSGSNKVSQNATATSVGSQQNATATSVAVAQAAAFKAELQAEAQISQKKGIGISDGHFVFDTFTGRSDVAEKQKAALALQKGDLSGAVYYLGKAISEDPTDGEAQIYNEDVHLLQNNAPYITIVLGLPIDNSSNLSFYRPDMESTYLAQHEINTGNGLPNGLKLRILIDSSGGDDANVGTVAQFVANRVMKGNLDHIIAVVGWPFSSETISARDILAGVHVPLISQTASSVKLSGSSPYFFRVNPPDDLQGATLGGVAVTQFHAKTILVMRDPSDTYSSSLADAFSKSVKALGATPINSPNDYFTEATTTNYQQVISDVQTNHADIIFLAGLDVDAIRLAHAIGYTSRLSPQNTQLANLQILGGDAIDTGLILGQGSNADAQLALNYPQDMRRLHFTAFGHPDEWTYEKFPQAQQPVFFSEWISTYQSSSVEANNAPAPSNDAILTYDALRVIITATTLVQGPLTGQAIRNALASLGQSGIAAYQGVSGRILFDANGNPVQKAVVVLDVEIKNGNNAIVLNQVAGTFR